MSSDCLYVLFCYWSLVYSIVFALASSLVVAMFVVSSTTVDDNSVNITHNICLGMQ